MDGRDVSVPVSLLRSAEASLLHTLRHAPQAGGFVTLPVVVVEGWFVQVQLAVQLLREAPQG